MKRILLLHSFKPKQLRRINACRLYLQVITLSDITDGSGLGFTKCYSCTPASKTPPAHLHIYGLNSLALGHAPSNSGNVLSVLHFHEFNTFSNHLSAPVLIPYRDSLTTQDSLESHAHSRINFVRPRARYSAHLKNTQNIIYSTCPFRHVRHKI